MRMNTRPIRTLFSKGFPVPPEIEYADTAAGSQQPAEEITGRTGFQHEQQYQYTLPGRG